MIYLITGTPGAAKTLYSVAKLIPELLNAKIDNFNGRRRLLVDGIPELAFDHVPLSPCHVVEEGNNKTLRCAEGQGVNTWVEWCQPADLIVIDEAQRYFRPRTMGSKVPDYIAHLETHRHKGIDFVFITQNPMLIDQNIRRLVNQHFFIRRIWSLKASMVYQWDGCHADHSGLDVAQKSVFRFPQSAFTQYKSSELHIKPRAKIPLLLYIPLLALPLGLYFVPKAIGSVGDAVSGKAITSANPLKAAQSSASAALSPRSPASAVAQPVQLASAPAKPAIQGCISSARTCKCFDSQGAEVVPLLDACLMEPGRPPADLSHVQDTVLPPPVDPPDLELIRDTTSEKRRRSPLASALGH